MRATPKPRTERSTSRSTSRSRPRPSAREVIYAPTWKRVTLGFGIFRELLEDVTDPDVGMLFALTLNGPRYLQVSERLARDPEGRRLLAERPVLDERSLDLDALAKLPEHTFGGALARFMATRGLTLLPPFEVADDPVEYLAGWARSTHDIWHLATGIDTDPVGETELQAFTLGNLRTQTPYVTLPTSLPILVTKHGARVGDVLRRWRRAYRRGRRARDLFSFRWDEHWNTPLVEVRTRLGLARDEGDVART